MFNSLVLSPLQRPHPASNFPQDRSCHEKCKAPKVYVIIRDGTVKVIALPQILFPISDQIGVKNKPTVFPESSDLPVGAILLTVNEIIISSLA